MKRQSLWFSGSVGVVLAMLGVLLLIRPARAPLGLPWPTPTITPVPTPVPTPTATPAPSPQFVLQAVPFTAQAPLNQWSDGRFQDACEEAVILMAMKWARAESLGTPAEVSREIIALVDWQKQLYGEYRDRSAADTAILLRDYFDYPHVEVTPNATLAAIKAALQEDALVITPMNGRAMGNPYFTPPGPERHMVLIKGYDPATKQFITNDAGTQNGKDYRYNEDIFYAAIRDYPTGYHVPITTVEKPMIVVWK